MIQIPPDAWVMNRALRLAEKGRGWTEPNPMVGAILMKDGKRIGEGYHTKYGAAHAEVEALRDCEAKGLDPRGATLYVTLEPCCHHGKTPPCVEAVLASGIERMVVAAEDPNPKVAGKGLARLREAGVVVEVGLLEKQARELNRFFYHFHETGCPWVTLKAALSLDGKIAVKRGEQCWLTGAAAKRYVHGLRHEHQAILVGAGTVLADDPHLGVREVPGRDPLRVILKDDRPLPSALQIFRDENVLVLEENSIKKILKVLAEQNVHSLLVEGGQKIFTAFVKAKAVDEVQLLMAPVFLGQKALDFLDEDLPFTLEEVTHKKLGPDLLLKGRIQ
ncbi:bifunctional diaminohydroxyphosphoribosylaminopyrimidine deaminase/5-amino-6-(5-phosphoribosylamino)uracil reductase RibD [Candidatus Peregrinibacteria bacterium]|nr:MAG: bifunctional diaminohydroxyphosphoribosylaminopyrimidine deaminase/5-amino-6-(5-phosphoribosylamino)uracil reductase RibD [Candidatus Peregrinibacteria bacterium]